MIIVVGGIKGGTGKSTLATNLAVISSHRGKKVMLIDADEQESSYDWAEQRDSQWRDCLKNGTVENCPTLSFPTIKLGGKLLYEQIRRFNADYDDIVVDTGGRDTSSQRSALLIANIFLIPFKPRSLDIWTIGKVRSLIEDCMVHNPNLQILVCINQGDSRGVDNDESFKILEEIPRFKVIPNTIGHRKAFSNASAQGLGVLELAKRDIKACDEVYALYDAIHS